VFPTRTLLAADGSKDARRAARKAAELSLKLDSELHVFCVAPEYPYVYTSRGVRRREDKNTLKVEYRRTLDGYVDHIRQAGATVAESHLGAGGATSEIVER
jgi:nucleotide-binding universal stress UspA family protein